MTAFEILLNKFYDTIEENEPKKLDSSKDQHKLKELHQIIRKFVTASFYYGHNLEYRFMLSDLLIKSGEILQKTHHEEWSRVKYTFMENDLHFIKRDRNKTDIQKLKMNLQQLF